MLAGLLKYFKPGGPPPAPPLGGGISDVRLPQWPLKHISLGVGIHTSTRVTADLTSLHTPRTLALAADIYLRAAVRAVAPVLLYPGEEEDLTMLMQLIDEQENDEQTD